jgi:K+-sensing histidine kinase KdpD
MWIRGSSRSVGEGGLVRLARSTVALAALVAIICALTTVLWYLKLGAAGLRHPVFAYLPVIAVVAFLYGALPALLSSVAALACSAFFLYDPVYSFEVANRLEIGDLVCFAVLALIGVKCTVELLRRPPASMPSKSRLDPP